MAKYNRNEVYNKYGGLCAYTGRPLGDKWQVDHVTPRGYRILGTGNDINNLVPTIAIVNHYKRCADLKSFRVTMLTFHKRLAKLPKKTNVEATKRRIVYMQTLAELFNITTDKPFTGKFYFETLKQ